MATGPTSTFTQKVAQMKSSAEEVVYWVVNMTTEKGVEIQIRLSDAETEATTWYIADTDRIVSQLDRQSDGIPLNEQMKLEKEQSIRTIEFTAWWQAVGVQELWETIKQGVIHIGYATMHLISHISESILWMGSVTILPPIFLSGYITSMWERHMDQTAKWITFDMCSSTMTGLPVSTIWRRHSHILPCKANTIFTEQKISMYYSMPINSEILAEHIFYASRIVRTSHCSALCHVQYIIWEHLMSMECSAESH